MSKSIIDLSLLNAFEGVGLANFNSKNKGYGEQFFPLYFEVPNEFIKENTLPMKYLFPYEPVISLTMQKNIVRRDVCKGVHQGTVKEFWTNGDWDIDITGVFMGEKHNQFPVDDFSKLKNFLIYNPLIRVYCEPLQILDIHYIFINDIVFPFTKGENVQGYQIKASSDSYRLLMEEMETNDINKPLLIEV